MCPNSVLLINELPNFIILTIYIENYFIFASFLYLRSFQMFACIWITSTAV